MFITCQECNTTFRLDEKLLKPTGSKVRCSLCHYTFIATPPAGAPFEAPRVQQAPASEEAPPVRDEEPEAQSLDGIDLAELDSILENESIPALGEDADNHAIPTGEAASIAAAGGELDDLDLDFDFDAALEVDDTQFDDTQIATPPTTEAPVPNDLNLDADFEIGDETLVAEFPPFETSEALTEPPETASDQAATAAGVSDGPRIEDDLQMALEGLGLDEKPTAGDGSADESADQAEFDLNGLDFDLDVDDSGERNEEEQELSLDEDLLIDMGEDADVEPETPSTDELSLDLDFDLKAADATAHGQESESDLGLADELDLSLDEPAQDGGQSGEAGDLMLDLEDDLELDGDAAMLGPEMDETTAQPAPLADDDLDMGELDALLNGVQDSTKEDSDEDGELELDLALDDMPAAGSPAKPSAEDEPEDLDFELDNEFVDNSTMQPLDVQASAADSAEDEEVDLSDIEQMLESESKAADASDDLEIDFGQDDVDDASDEIDLAELESAIDTAEINEPEFPDEDVELELDFDLDNQKPEPSPEEPDEALSLDLDQPQEELQPQGDDLELDLELSLEGDAAKPDTQTDDELDLSDLSDIVEAAGGATKADIIDDGDIELEFQIEEDAEATIAEPLTTATTAGGIASESTPRMSGEQTMDTLVFEEGIPDDHTPAKSKKKEKEKEKRSKSLLIVLILIILLLCAIGGGVYYAVTQMDIQIPYVSEYLNPKPQDLKGTQMLSVLDINSKFIDNQQSGRLFVITGKVRNGYSEPHNKIRLQGKLFAKGEVELKNEYVYAGKTIDDQELATLPITEIKQRLNAVTLTADSTQPLLPGQNKAFMVVFSDLPPSEELDRFGVDLVSSAKAQ